MVFGTTFLYYPFCSPSTLCKHLQEKCVAPWPNALKVSTLHSEKSRVLPLVPAMPFRANVALSSISHMSVCLSVPICLPPVGAMALRRPNVLPLQGGLLIWPLYLVGGPVIPTVDLCFETLVGCWFWFWSITLQPTDPGRVPSGCVCGGARMTVAYTFWFCPITGQALV